MNQFLSHLRFAENNTALGMGLRSVHVQEILSTWPELDYFEIISENFMGKKGPQHKNLDQIKERYPIVLHGVAMNLGSADDLNWEYLKSLKSLADEVDAPFVSDHLCWTGIDGFHLHDLLPLPQNEETLKFIAEKIRIVQDFIERPFGIENLSSYAIIEPTDLSEVEFYTGVIAEANCYAMLDINNVFVSAQNHRFDAQAYLEKINWKKVLQCHIAGHSEEQNGVIIDTHDCAVSDEVWELYQKAWELSGGFKTLIEWDAKIPAFDEVYAELNKAKALQTHLNLLK